MNTNTHISTCLLACLSVSSFAALALTSPDGQVVCDWSIAGDHISCRASYAQRPAFEFSAGVSRAPLIEAGRTSRTVNAAWRPVWGFMSEYPENFTEEVIEFRRDAKGHITDRMTLRCYNEGVAIKWAHRLGVYGTGTIAGEVSAWRLAEGSRAWCIPGTESTFPTEPLDVTTLDSNIRWRMPFTAVTRDGIYMSIMEANVREWPRSYLRREGNVLHNVFAVGIKEGRNWVETPWRAVELAPSAAKLVERAYFIENLNDPCAIKDTNWIKPGFCISDQSNCELVTEQVIAAGRAAKALGAKYVQIDWGWYGTEYAWSDDDRRNYAARHPELKDDPNWIENTRANPYTAAKGTVPYHPYWPYSGRTGVEFDIPAIVSALKAMDIGLCLYVHGCILESYDMDKLFAEYERWGIAGLKPGFVSYGSERATEWMRQLAATAARHHLWLDIHDGQIPDGFERTWPNLMITEGGGGEEGNHPARQDVTLPFTRCLCGPFDFTPIMFKAERKGIPCTKLHGAAFFLVYPGSTAIMRGNAQNVVENEKSICEFLRALPWNYDETRVLEAEVGKFITVARRRGNDWFIAGMSGEEAHTAVLDFSFLPTGREFKLNYCQDDGVNYRTASQVVTSATRLSIPLNRVGGFIATLTPRGK